VFASLAYPITQVHLAERVKNARKTHGVSNTWLFIIAAPRGVHFARALTHLLFVTLSFHDVLSALSL
jgi:hypothetical protein